ncbi:MAG: HAD-IIIA family hydrolase [Thermoanaerobaculia bacterium]
MKRALFLDRDGIVSHLVYYADTGEWEAPRRVGDVEMIDGVREPLRRLADAGWLIVVVTNQPSYAKGKIDRESLEAVHEAVIERLGVPVAHSYVCFHHPEATVEAMRVRCDCRKPGTASLFDAEVRFDLDLAASWMVGDQDTDLVCGRAAGCRVALVEHEGSAHKRGGVEPDLRCDDLAELADSLLGGAS